MYKPGDDIRATPDVVARCDLDTTGFRQVQVDSCAEVDKTTALSLPNALTEADITAW